MVKLYFSSGYSSHIMPDGSIWDRNSWLCVEGDNYAQIKSFVYNKYNCGVWYTEEEIQEEKPRKNGIVFTFNIQEND